MAAAPRRSGFWTRRRWMRLAAINALFAIAVLIASGGLPTRDAELVRLGAQLQFAHGMATIACATFINIGAARARQAPALFLSGSMVVAAAHYAAGLTGAPLNLALVLLGSLAIGSGWLVLIAAASEVDR